MKTAMIISCVAALGVAACDVPPTSTADRFQQSEAGWMMLVSDSCQVTRARWVELVDDSAAAERRATTGQLAGTASGALIGGALGRQVGDGSGQRIATVLGAIGGGLTGAAAAGRIDASQRTMLGVEYTATVDGQRIVVVQNIDRDAQPLQPGQRCRVIQRGNEVRLQRA